MKKVIKITLPCVADRYAGPHERIIEFSGSKHGGLISIRENDDGSLIVEPYRMDEGVTVRNTPCKETVNALKRLTEKVQRANEIQHSRRDHKITQEDWAELYQLTNEARAVLAKATGEK